MEVIISMSEIGLVGSDTDERLKVAWKGESDFWRLS